MLKPEIFRFKISKSSQNNNEHTINEKRNILFRKQNMIDKWGRIVYYDKWKNTIEGVYTHETGNC